MISLTRKTDYALVALAHLAQRRDECDCDDLCPTSARAVADQFALPRDVVMSILKDLQRAGLVESERGAKGGYTLPRDADEISLADVVEAIEGPARLAPCCAEEDDDLCTVCALVPRCPITAGIQDVNARISEFLRTVTLRQLMNVEKGEKLPVVELKAV